MNIHFEPLTISEELAKQMALWYSDPDIAPFIHPNLKEEEPLALTWEDIMKQEFPNPKIEKYLIMDDHLAIGELSITQDFFWLIKKEPKSAWISIVIGKKSYWGNGIAQSAMTFLEDHCRRSGYQRIELGVFEHNLKAQHLYRKMGYQEFIRKPHFTYSLGQWRADIRMEKIL